MSYNLTLALPKGNTYFAACQINFDLASVPTKPFWVDFRGVKIADYKINDALVEEDEVFYDHRIVMPAKYLKVGPN